MEPFDEEFLGLVKRHLYRSRGVDLSGYSPSFVMRAIRKRVSRSNATSQAAYAKLLTRSDEETNELLSALSINVTEFFRDMGAFESFSEKVIRPLLKGKVSTGGGVMRIWSAGCATGQETYTIMICVAEELKRSAAPGPMIMSVTGTDISKAAIAKAKAGVYAEEEVRGVPSEMLKEYFVRNGNNYEVIDDLAKRVRFRLENLLDKPGSKFYDAIVCRNVLIYFSRQMHEIVMENLFEALRPGGYLMLGRTEALIGQIRSRFEIIDQENRILRRVG
jgi:chemotaxis methyl-accepting protein methylase